MSITHSKKNTWTSLLGCLGTGVFVVSLTLAFILPTLHAQQSSKKLPADHSRENFHRAAAIHLKIPTQDLIIHPASSNPAEADLQIGDLYPWHVWKKDGPRLLAGFASPNPRAAIAFDGSETGISALLKACQILDPEKRPSPEQLARRISFCLNHPTITEILFDPLVYEANGQTPPNDLPPPSLQPQKTGQLLTYITMKIEKNGSWKLRKISITILPDLQIIIHREDL